jgi:uncharacterized protein YndB with AHSA1/START domain
VAVDVLTSILIERPPAEVSAYVCDPQNAPRWYVNIKASHWVGEPGVRRGARAAFVAFFLGRKLEYTYEFIEYEPGRLLSMTTAQGPFPMTTEYRFEPVGNQGQQTTMSLRNYGDPSGFSKVLAPIMSRAMRSANQKDLLNLKEILESSAFRQE